jgi:transcriptional regulator with XRE-family HTH domain
MPASKVAQAAGLSHSYLSHLESGKYGDIGLEKFLRLIKAMHVSLDEVLQEAGLLNRRALNLPDPETYLTSQYKLSPESLTMAVEFLNYLASRDKKAARQSTTSPPGKLEPLARKR